MGAATSRLAETAWESADGGLGPEGQCVRQADSPLAGYEEVTLAKRNALNRRSFDVMDANGTKIFSTEVASKTRMHFEVVDSTGQKVVRVTTGPYRRVWEVYTYEKPAKDAQPDGKVSAKAEAPVYKRAVLKLGFQRIDGDFCLVGNDGTMGPPLFHAEAIKGVKAKVQAYGVPAGFDKKVAAELPPLCAYWDWQHNFLRAKHWVTLKLAKGTDRLAFIICVVIFELMQQENPAGATS